MSTDPHNNPDHNADAATGDSPRDTTPDREVVIVDDQGKPYRQKTNAYKKFKVLMYGVYDRIPHGERLMILLTSVIALSTVCQMVISCNNNASTGKQVDRIIAAADGVKVAADSFSHSADGINNSMVDAVTKLNLQADKLGANADQTGRLADNTDKANTNVVESDRPWMGAVPSIGKFEVGSTVTLGFIFVNSGKRPAFIKTARTHFDAYIAFPKDPDSQYTNPHNERPSTNFILPGMNATNSTTGSSLFDQQVMDLLQSGVMTYYLFGKIVYTDIVTGKEHVTHACVQYYPVEKPPLIVDGAIAKTTTMQTNSAALSRFLIEPSDACALDMPCQKYLTRHPSRATVIHVKHF